MTAIDKAAKTDYAPFSMKTMTGYLAPEGYLPELLNELGGLTTIEKIYERLIFTSEGPVPSAWAQNVWLNPQIIQIHSISQAAQALRAIQRNWALYSVHSHRRAHLISEKLPKVSSRRLTFPAPQPTTPIGSWTLIENETLIASPHCSSLFPHGEIFFVEEKFQPPSRAYLKLWEALTRLGQMPQPGSRCLDMGSSPGGWTWALHKMGMQVVSVDKAPLAPHIAALPGIEFLRRDAFTLNPLDVGPIDWFFSDVICYPEKLFELVKKWLASGLCKKFICTIKFQGKELTLSDQKAVRAFTELPGSTVCHLFHNKHELTWIKL